MTPDQWKIEIDRLEKFFRETPILIKEYKNGHSIITDIPKFIDSHLSAAKANLGNMWFERYLNRLQELEQAIINQTKSPPQG